MAVLTPDKRTAFWRIYIADVDMTDVLKNVITGMSVIYLLNGTTEAQISIMSESYVEDLFVEKQPIGFSIGYDPYNLVEMFDGYIVAPPNGSANDNISYTITATGKEQDMTNIVNNRIFQIPKKAAIISQIAVENGYISNIQIDDNNNIPAKYLTFQNNKTDLQILNECAVKWNCLYWFEEPNHLYFYDSEKAHDLGDFLKRKKNNIEDLRPTYDLGFRTDYAMNNVADLSWSFKARKGGGQGGLSNFGSSESGRITKAGDYQIDYNGKIWKLKPKYLAQVKTNPLLYGKYVSGVISAGVSDVKVSIKKYFVVVTHNSPTRKNLSSSGGHMSGNLNLNVKLNIGDPFLRPPRNAYLYSGSLNPNALTSDLPNFLLKYSNPQKYKINKVTTELRSGKIDTSLDMTLGGFNV